MVVMVNYYGSKIIFTSKIFHLQIHRSMRSSGDEIKIYSLMLQL